MSLSRVQVLSLYRSLMREGRGLVNYNFRDHARRRINFGFREFRKAEPAVALEKYRFGVEQLALLKRQAIISQLYPEDDSVAVSWNKMKSA